MAHNDYEAILLFDNPADRHRKDGVYHRESKFKHQGAAKVMQMKLLT